jgi:hypothetical protein
LEREKGRRDLFGKPARTLFPVQEALVKPVIFLRSASVLTLIHCVGHTVRGVLSGPTHGAEESAVIENRKSHAFNFGGLQRNYWDFHLGYGWFLTVLLFVLALVFWNLAGVAKTNSLLIRPILGLFCLNFLAMAIVALEVFLSGVR